MTFDNNHLSVFSHLLLLLHMSLPPSVCFGKYVTGEQPFKHVIIKNVCKNQLWPVHCNHLNIYILHSSSVDVEKCPRNTQQW